MICDGDDVDLRARRQKKRAGRQALLEKLCRPCFPQKFDLILIDGVALLFARRAPPETWTTRHQPVAGLRLDW
jgi:hypothetical protein